MNIQLYFKTLTIILVYAFINLQSISKSNDIKIDNQNIKLNKIIDKVVGKNNIPKSDLSFKFSQFDLKTKLNLNKISFLFQTDIEFFRKNVYNEYKIRNYLSFNVGYEHNFKPIDLGIVNNISKECFLFFETSSGENFYNSIFKNLSASIMLSSKLLLSKSNNYHIHGKITWIEWEFAKSLNAVNYVNRKFSKFNKTQLYENSDLVYQIKDEVNTAIGSKDVTKRSDSINKINKLIKESEKSDINMLLNKVFKDRKIGISLEKINGKEIKQYKILRNKQKESIIFNIINKSLVLCKIGLDFDVNLFSSIWLGLDCSIGIFANELFKIPKRISNNSFANLKFNDIFCPEISISLKYIR